jgi:hypothetical protein
VNVNGKVDFGSAAFPAVRAKGVRLPKENAIHDAPLAGTRWPDPLVKLA